MRKAQTLDWIGEGLRWAFILTALGVGTWAAIETRFKYVLLFFAGLALVGTCVYQIYRFIQRRWGDDNAKLFIAALIAAWLISGAVLMVVDPDGGSFDDFYCQPFPPYDCRYP